MSDVDEVTTDNTGEETPDTGEITPDDNDDIPSGEETPDAGDTPPDDGIGDEEEEIPDADEIHKIKIMRHAYQKLDALPLGFGLPSYSDNMTDEEVSRYFSLDLSDTLRESKITISTIGEDSYDEMMIENRVVYHALKRFRLTSATFFKFSTATDGKTVDKTNVPKMLKQIMDEYDAEYKSWKSKGASGIWNRTATLKYTNV